MSVTLMCPNLKCRHILNVPDDSRGHKVRCGNCGTTLVVPATKAHARTAPSTREETPDGEDDSD